MYPSERKFTDHLESKGKNWIYHPRLFRFKGTIYQSDFYCPEDDTYYEVAGTKQAISAINYKIIEFKKSYPNIKFIIVKPNGEPYIGYKINRNACESKLINSYYLSQEQKFIKFVSSRIHLFPHDNKLRTKLRKFLNEKDMGLEKAAIYFDLSTGLLSKFLNDKTNPNERNLHKIRKGLGLIKNDEK